MSIFKKKPKGSFGFWQGRPVKSIEEYWKIVLVHKCDPMTGNAIVPSNPKTPKPQAPKPFKLFKW